MNVLFTCAVAVAANMIGLFVAKILGIDDTYMGGYLVGSLTVGAAFVASLLWSYSRDN